MSSVRLFSQPVVEMVMGAFFFTHGHWWKARTKTRGLENMTEAEPGWIPGLEASIYQWTVISDRDKGKFPLSCTRPLADII